MSFKDIAQRKRRLRDELIEKGLESEKLRKSDPSVPRDTQHDKYLKATASEIVKHIQNRDPGWTAMDVLKAYIARAAEAQAQTNCLTEVLFAESIETARQLDEKFSQTHELVGPLHGVPVSFKDQYKIEGVATSVGFTQWADRISKEDAELVRLVRTAGGIPFVKTNVPQTMLSFECGSPLWGRTTNPDSSAHTCGGSSGGEAALLALDGSALGFGSDVGGSLRIPPAYCGIYGIKPGTGRFSKHGIVSVVPGFEGVSTVTGPMGRSVADIELASRLLMGKSSYKSEGIPPVPYRDIRLPQKLRFGYYTSDKLCKASPAVERAILESVAALQKEGHECIEFEPFDVQEGMRIFIALTAADAYRTLQSHLGPDPVESSLYLVTLPSRLPGFARSIAARLAGLVTGDRIFAHLFSNSRVRTVGEYWAETAKKHQYEEKWIEEVWGKYKFDGIICPASAAPALPHGGTKTLSPLAVSTILYSVLEYPAAVLPVTRVDPSKDAITDAWKSAPGHGSKIVEEELYFAKKPVYNPELMKGLPVGVQLVGNKWEDEKVIAMMRVLDDALGARGFGAGSSLTK